LPPEGKEKGQSRKLGMKKGPHWTPAPLSEIEGGNPKGEKKGFHYLNQDP